MGRIPYSEDHVKGQTICEGSAIGANASVLPGARISRSSIRGEKSLVARDVPDCRVVIGIPKRVRD
jgi:acetyltransferase-like isoleucine patch superfamily enzyme